MGNKVGFGVHKQRTLADVKGPKTKAARKAQKAEKAFVDSLNIDIGKELKAIKTQSQLMNIKDLVDTYGSRKNRPQFNKLNSIYKNTARVLIDMEFETMNSREQLESIRSMVDLNGSANQKARFAEFESYFIAQGKNVKVPPTPNIELPNIFEHLSGGAQGAGNVATNGAGKGGKAIIADLPKFSKFFKKGWLGAGAAAALFAAWKIGSELGKSAGAKSSGEKKSMFNIDLAAASISKPEGKSDKQPKVKPKQQQEAAVQPSIEAEKQAAAVQENDSTRVAKVDTVEAVSEVESTNNVTANTENVTSPKVEKRLTDEEAVNKINEYYVQGKTPENKDYAEIYIVKKGDFVWNFAKQYLQKHNDIRLIVRQIVMGDKCNEPSEDAIILYFTEEICKLSGIKYIIDDNNLMHNDPLFVPKLDAA